MYGATAFGAKPAMGGSHHYRDLELTSKLEGATPHSLISILYDELTASLDVIAVALKQGRSISQHKHSTRARSIILALLASLDFKKGGEVANALGTVYRSMARELSKVVADNDAERLAKLRDGLDEVVKAWKAIG